MSDDVSLTVEEVTKGRISSRGECIVERPGGKKLTKEKECGLIAELVAFSYVFSSLEGEG